MDPQPPLRTATSIARGLNGWPTYALQRALNTIREGVTLTIPWPVLAVDGIFGPGTEDAVKKFQKWMAITQDGVVGPVTQGRLLLLVEARLSVVRAGMPDGMMRGFVESEGGNMLAAVNTTVKGGVDCGPVQLRCYGPPFDMEELAIAFNPIRAMMRAADDFIARMQKFHNAPWPMKAATAVIRLERANRLAAMSHNWPEQGGASFIAEHGKCSNPDAKCSWLPRNADGTSRVRFPDGTRVETRWQWCQFYAMGHNHGAATGVVKYVKKWS